MGMGWRVPLIYCQNHSRKIFLFFKILSVKAPVGGEGIPLTDGFRNWDLWSRPWGKACWMQIHESLLFIQNLILAIVIFLCNKLSLKGNYKLMQTSRCLQHIFLGRCCCTLWNGIRGRASWLAGSQLVQNCKQQKTSPLNANGICVHGQRCKISKFSTEQFCQTKFYPNIKSQQI